MTQLNVKGSPRKIDPRAPKSHPGYQKAIRAAERRQKQMTFESEGQRKDYERKVNSNPNNILGLPPFYPPEVLRTAGIDKVLTDEEKKQKETWDKKLVVMGNTRLWCTRCRKETEHGIDMESSYCKKCGGKAPYHY